MYYGSDDLISVAIFPKKLYNLINNPAYQSLISWTKTGDQFIVYNPSEFAEKILSGNEFSCTNYASFVRQLNMYDFHKVKNRNRDKSDIFYNKNFIKDKPSLLSRIKRKGTNNQSETEDRGGQIQVCNKSYLPGYCNIDVLSSREKLANINNHNKLNSKDEEKNNNNKNSLIAINNSNSNILNNNFNHNTSSSVNGNNNSINPQNENNKKKYSKHILNSLYTNFLKTVSIL